MSGWLAVSADASDSWITSSVDSSLGSSVMTSAISAVGIVRTGDAMSSCRVIFGVFGGPDGCQDRAPGTLFFMPGIWTILNLYLRVFSFRFLSRALHISSRDLSPKILISGRWSTAMVKLEHPSTK